MHADAQQADRPPSSFGLLEEPYGSLTDVLFVARCGLALAACDRREVVVADLDRDGSGRQLVARQPVRRMPGNFGNLLLYHRQIGQVAFEGVFAARRLGFVLGYDRAVVTPVRQFPEPVGE